VTGLSLG